MYVYLNIVNFFFPSKIENHKQILPQNMTVNLAMVCLSKAMSKSNFKIVESWWAKSGLQINSAIK